MSGLRRALLGLAALALAIGAGSAAIILTSNHTELRGMVTALILVAGWGFAGTGLYAWDRRPDNNVGPLMTAIGFTWFLQGLESSNNSVVFAIGVLGSSLPFAILVHLLVTFPTGKLESRLQKVVVAAGYFATTVLQVAWALLTDPEEAGCEGCPDNPILIEGHTALGDAIGTLEIAVAFVVVATAVVLVFRRWRRSPPRERAALTPVVSTGGLAFLLLLAQLVASGVNAPHFAEQIPFIGAVAVFSCLPFAFLAGLVRSRIWRAEELSTALSAENEQLTAELRATVAELRASRARIVAAGYEERRRVERDLHDGAQQRLVALTMNLKLARSRLDSDPEEAAALLDEATEELAEATRELRELARGIHPAVLSDRGLDAALSGLADRSPVPVEVRCASPDRLPPAVESAAYFVAAEALTNVARYAQASGATVTVGRRDGFVAVEVSDDGVGGADPAGGTGLRGLADRVAALDGELEVESPAGGGTRVRARIPLSG